MAGLNRAKLYLSELWSAISLCKQMYWVIKFHIIFLLKKHENSKWKSLILFTVRQHSLAERCTSYRKPVRLFTSERNSKGNTGREGSDWERYRENRQFLANNLSRRIAETVQDRTSHNDGLIGSRIPVRAFDWSKIIDFGWSWTAKTHSVAEKFGAHCRNFNKDRSILSAAEMWTNDSSFWKYKVHADIRGSSSRPGRQMTVGFRRR